MKIRKYLGPQRLFVWHSFHGFFVLLLLLTGFGMYFADFGSSIIDFDARQQLHEIVGIAVSIIYVLFFAVFHLEANKHRVSYWWRKFLHTLFVTKELAVKHENHQKKIFSRYQIIMFLLFPIIIITGFALLYPEYSLKTIGVIDIYHVILLIHIIIAIFLLLFLTIHTYIVLIDKKKFPFLHSFLKFWFSL